MGLTGAAYLGRMCLTCKPPRIARPVWEPAEREALLPACVRVHEASNLHEAMVPCRPNGHRARVPTGVHAHRLVERREMRGRRGRARAGGARREAAVGPKRWAPSGLKALVRRGDRGVAANGDGNGKHRRHICL